MTVVLGAAVAVVAAGVAYVRRRPGKSGGDAPGDAHARFGARCRALGLRPRTRVGRAVLGVGVAFGAHPTTFGRSIRGKATLGIRLGLGGPRQATPLTQLWAGPVPKGVEVFPAAAIPGVDALLGRPDVRVGDADLDRLARLTGDPARVQATLDEPVRRALAALLAQPRGRVEAGWVVIELDGHACDTPELAAAASVAQAAAESMRRAGGRPVAQGLFLVARDDPDPTVRARAAEAHADLHGAVRGADWAGQLAALAAAKDDAVAVPAAIAARDHERLLAVVDPGPLGRRAVEAIGEALTGRRSPKADRWVPWALARLAAGGVAGAAAADVLGRHAPVTLLPELGRLAADASLPAATQRAARTAAAGVRARTDPAEAGRLGLADGAGAADGRLGLADGAAGTLAEAGGADDDRGSA